MSGGDIASEVSGPKSGGIHFPMHILHLLQEVKDHLPVCKDALAQPVKDVMALYTSGAFHPL